MKVLVCVDFQDEKSKVDFINSTMNALGEICGGSAVDCSEMNGTSVIHCIQPQGDVSLEKPADQAPLAPTDIPPAETVANEPEMAMAIELPAEAPITAPEVVDIPASPMDVPAPEPAPEPAPSSQIDQGPHIIVSLSSTYEVDAVSDVSIRNSRLEVGSAGVNSGDNQTAVDFWYNGIEFFMPALDDSIKASVINPEHEIKPNTIRIVVSKPGQDGTYAMLVDVEAPDPTNFQKERLVIGSDTAPA